MSEFVPLPAPSIGISACSGTTYGAKGDLNVGDLDYVEFQVAASTSPVKNLTLGVKGYWTPEQSTHRLSRPRRPTRSKALSAYTLPAVGIFTPTISGGYG